MSVLFVDGVKYFLWIPKDEENEFHPIVRKCSKVIFGENSLYFDVKHVLKSLSGIGSIPDAYVIDLSKRELYIVEIELSSHPVYDHIVKQLTKFINGIENPHAKNQIINMLYEEINRDIVLKATIQKTTGSPEVYRFISTLLSKPPRIIVIVDKKTSEIEEACKVLKYQPSIVELKIFSREDAENVQAYLFEPVSIVEKAIEKAKEGEKLTPRHYRDWESMLAWVNDNVREIVYSLKNEIMSLRNVVPVIHGKYLCFYKGKPSIRSIFAVFLLTKEALNIRIRVEPSTFKDPKGLLKNKVYKGWFFKRGAGQEREFKIKSKEQIPYAMGLIKQSYEISG